MRLLTKTREAQLVRLIDQGLLSVCPVLRLVNHQYRANRFDRYDLAVRWLAIEDYFGENDCGFRLYNKMQDARNTRVGSEARFKSLIESVRREGIDCRSAISITLDGRIASGSHRPTLAMYFGVDALQVQVINAKSAKTYGLDWFRSQGFTPEEINLIESTRSRMFHRTGLFYHAIVWPPESQFCKEIVRDLSTSYPLENIRTLKLPEMQLAELLEKVHQFDESPPGQFWKTPQNVPDQASQASIISFEIPNPEFHLSSSDPDMSNCYAAVELINRYQGRSDKQVDSKNSKPFCFVSGNYLFNRIISESITSSELHGFNDESRARI